MKTKQFLFSLLTLFMFGLFACEKPEEAELIPVEGLKTSQTLNRISDPNDPNLNPSWAWNDESQSTIPIYYNTTTGTVSKNAPLPWKTQGNPLNVPNPDIKTADGWILAFKDVGTPSRHVDMPFFAVYNRYRGILRVFVYNVQNISASYFIGEVSYNTTVYSASSLGFVAPENASVMDNFKKDEIQRLLAHANTYESWINFDINLTNYDPNNTTNSWLKLNITRVNESAISLNSTEFNLKSEYLSQVQPGGNSGSADIKSLLQYGQKSASGFDALNKILKDSKIEAVKNILRYTQVIPAVGQILGVVNSFIGGKTTPLPWQMIQLNGSLKLDGTLVSEVKDYSIVFSLVKGGSLNSAYYQPISDIKFGVFNLTTTPVLKGQAFVDSNEDPQWGTDYTHYGTIRIENNANLILNPTLTDYTLVSKEVSIMDLNTGFVNFASNGVATLPFRVYSGPTYEFQHPTTIGVKYTFKINGNPTLDNEIVFMKVYKVNSQIQF